MKEEWRDSPYKGYSVSSIGRVMGPRGKILSVGRNRDNRPCVSLQSVLVRKKLGVHALVCETFHGPRPTPKHHAAHKNDDPEDNRSDNLYWATPQQNRLDMIRNGKSGGPRPENAYGVKLNWDIVREVRKRFAEGQRQVDISKAMGLRASAVSEIVNNKRWVEYADRT